MMAHPQPPPKVDVSTIAAAYGYAQLGWHVFPLRPNDKRPAVTDWENKATTDPQRIQAAWTGPYAHSGIGIACGPSRLVVVDLDTAKGDTPPEPWNLPGIVDGADVLAELYSRAGDRVPFGATPIARTASGGLHLYFAAPEVREVRNSTSKVGWKIDVRAGGGYVVAPPSTAAGQPYTWETTPAVAAQPLPAWLLRRMLPEPQAPVQRPVAPRRGRRAEGYAATALDGEIERVLDAQPGTRNDTLHRAAFSLGQLVAAGRLEPRLVVDELLAAGAHIGLPEREVQNTITSGMRAGANNPRRAA